MTRTRFAVLGEGMIELNGAGTASPEIGYGGDTLNTAIHLARLGNRVDFISALGADPFSARLRAAWAGEGIGVDHVLTDAARLPGLYAITLDKQGERGFLYWRGDSAARQLFACAGIDATMAAAADAEILYLSLISLAVLSDHFDQVIDLCRDVRARGGQVAFDTNYRPALWSSPLVARCHVEAIAPFVDIALGGIEDEALLFDDGSPRSAVDRWQRAGASDIVIKCGANGCVAATDGTAQSFAVVPCPVIDASGAGDAFNAGYLAARVAGQEVTTAVDWGQRTARWVIGQNGAIPRTDENWSNLVDELVR